MNSAKKQPCSYFIKRLQQIRIDWKIQLRQEFSNRNLNSNQIGINLAKNSSNKKWKLRKIHKERVFYFSITPLPFKLLWFFCHFDLISISFINWEKTSRAINKRVHSNQSLNHYSIIIVIITVNSAPPDLILNFPNLAQMWPLSLPTNDMWSCGHLLRFDVASTLSSIKCLKRQQRQQKQEKGQEDEEKGGEQLSSSLLLTTIPINSSSSSKIFKYIIIYMY